jgi:hypothetical protein
MKADNNILGDGRRTRTRKESTQQSKDGVERKEKENREDSEDDKLQPINTVSLMDFQST